MPYIPPQNRPPIDQAVDRLAARIAGQVSRSAETVEVSSRYRKSMLAIAHALRALQQGKAVGSSDEEFVASAVFEASKGYNQTGGWLGELNYAVTILIQAVPFKLYTAGTWEESLRYWLYAETVGALTRTAYDIHNAFDDDFVGNGLAGVFEDIKDEYKRRVNTAYEAAQIRKSGDCYDRSPYRTQLVETEVAGVKGYCEVQLPRQEPSLPASPESFPYKHVCVTGGTGTVGSVLLKTLLAQYPDIEQVATTYRSPDSPRVQRLPVSAKLHATIGDIADPVVVREALENAEVVFHLAGWLANTDLPENHDEVFITNGLATGLIARLVSNGRR